MMGRLTGFARQAVVGERSAIDNTDWLKTFAIVMVAIDHTGYFFIEDADWWSVFGRLAAPVFFFLMGYAQTRRVPLLWIGVGLVLTLLESWNADWTWVSPNILLSFALIRLVRPHVQSLTQRYGWPVFFALVIGLICLLPVTGNLVDYGAEGWLWALFGLYQRIRMDEEPRSDKSRTTPADAMRLLACFAATAAYVWGEQATFLFTQPQFNTFMLGICALSVCLCLFRRGPSPIQPPRILVQPLRLIGRHTLLLYALQLGGSEIAVGLYPDLSP